MKSDGVSTAFAIIMEEIASVEEQLNQEGINAFKDGKYEEAKNLANSGKRWERLGKNLKRFEMSGVQGSMCQREKE